MALLRFRGLHLGREFLEREGRQAQEQEWQQVQPGGMGMEKRFVGHLTLHGVLLFWEGDWGYRKRVNYGASAYDA